MAHAVVRKTSRLTPTEIRFLRRCVGWSGQDFAEHMGTTAETVSRWENGRAPSAEEYDSAQRTAVLSASWSAA